MRRASVLLAALGALALGGCVVQPPPIPPVPTSVVVADTTVTVDVPPVSEVVGQSTDAGECAIGSVRVRTGEASRDVLTVLATTATAACPDEEPLNGRYPTWGPTDALPADATPVDVPGAASAHRFAFDYTECTNSCTTVTREVLLAIVDDDLAVMVLSGDVGEPGIVDAQLASVRIG